MRFNCSKGIVTHSREKTRLDAVYIVFDILGLIYLVYKIIGHNFAARILIIRPCKLPPVRVARPRRNTNKLFF